MHYTMGKIVSRKCFATFFILILETNLVASLLIASILYCLHVERQRRMRIYFEDLVEQVNKLPEARWQAKYHPWGVKYKRIDVDTPFLRNSTAIRHFYRNIEEMFNSTRMAEHFDELESFADTRLPRHFDAREKWPHCASIGHVFNQGACGSCWAIGAMGVASDRTCIQTNASFTDMFSPQHVMECCPDCGTCLGGDPLRVV